LNRDYVIMGRAEKENKREKKERWLKPIQENLSGIRLEGADVACPVCQESGFVITRWIKGPSAKPIYVLHMRDNSIEDVCQISKEQALELRERISIPEKDIEALVQNKKPFVLFSGGKDSLATLIYLRRLSSSLTAVYVDTTAGLPENGDYVKKVCAYMGVDLKVVRPQKDYFTLAKTWGIPSFKYRWCCRELKIKPMANFFRSINEPKVVFDGIRAAESPIRKQYFPVWYHPGFKCLSVSPIFYWSSQQVSACINSNGIPKTLLHSLLNTSTECWCGAYKTESDFRKLYGLNKEMFQKLSDVEESTDKRYTFVYRKAKKIPLTTLEQEILLEAEQENK